MCESSLIFQLLNMQTQKEQSNILMLLNYFKLFKTRISIALFLVILSKLFSVADPYVMKKLIDILIGGLASFEIQIVVFLIVAFFVLRWGANVFDGAKDYVFAKAQTGIKKKISLDVFQHLIDLPADFHASSSTGGVSKKISRGSSSLEGMLMFLSFNVIPTLVEIFLVVIVFIKLFPISFTITFLGFIVVYVLFTIFISERRQGLLLETNKKDDNASKQSIDALLNYETVKYFTNEEFEYKRYGNALNDWSGLSVKSIKSGANLNMGQGFIITAGLTTILILAIRQYLLGQATVGDFVLVTTYLTRIAIPLGMLGFVYRRIKEGLADLNEMFKLLQVKNKIIDKHNARNLTACGGEIIFENVSFRYENKRNVLSEINLHIPPRTRIALVGYSGSGKSTISKLLFRLYDVTAGKIMIDGVDIRDIKQKSLRKCMGMVAQDTALFNDTIYHNISYGNPKAKKEDIYEAAKMANIHKFILKELPNGYDTIVGERGVKLSGGEKQRVAIARMLVKKPAILVFDEATASLDTKSEKMIQDEIKNISKGHITTIVIAHRLSTIVDFDKIVVMENGKIVEQGNHYELLKKQGIYYNLWQIQSRNTATTSSFRNSEPNLELNQENKFIK